MQTDSKPDTSNLKQGDLKTIAETLGKNPSYVRMVASGIANNAEIREAIEVMNDERAQAHTRNLEALRDSVRNEATTDIQPITHK